MIWKCWADLSPRDHPGNDSGERRTCVEPRAGQDSVFGLQMVKYQLEPTPRCWVPPLHTRKKKYFYNCSSCGLWLRWITNLQPLVFGEKQTVLFWGKNWEPEIIHASLFTRPEWGQKSISLCALSPFSDEFLTICTNKYGLVCVQPYTVEKWRVKGF